MTVRIFYKFFLKNKVPIPSDGLTKPWILELGPRQK